ncbi:RNA polymerase sigma-54 factor [Chlamydia muridarum str. Nigg]|jgi:RNA polymerase sigma-54 factor|uniref:RNA polymerase sigma54 factor n=2 Tax=Chlamydia muridarum TaxID=83560 RepID=A0A070A126_CHLMR|nr:RNA polymerase factor sigma-54 [Chlamydia muridarum]AAF73614.1 RNA polymerase sigma factor, sigma-54 family [Chlamydia muridarum str. Nigg]AHH23287.1 RNA polymerase sigma54 factor [Chlamydia muridarum str. Nigg3 CMUT3-5]AHH24213.1 RNA polymerase sigma54 factor [Chlamydia muridarum str. Nigg CM972]AID38411.1 RNA polymerase sigma54 factor [Chlamydia muridarum str. Nigg 2 MCR]AIT91041.1 RNA polymerase sigma54 factor [Chlamydia muridarum]
MLHQHQTASVALCPALHIQQSLDMLQMPVAELSEFLSQQITINPCFDLDALDDLPDTCSFFPISEHHPFTETLLSHLLHQIEVHFSLPQDRAIAQYIVGNLSPEGLFLEDPSLSASNLGVSDVLFQKIWLRIQQFHPLGIASSSLQSYWLSLLDPSSHKEALMIIRQHFNRLARCDFAGISKKIQLPIAKILVFLRQALASIPWCPAAGFPNSLKTPSPALPDAYLSFSHEKSWEIFMNKDSLPAIRLNSTVLHIYHTLPRDDKDHLSQQIRAAKQLLRNIKKREETLLAVLRVLIPYQEEFLLKKRSVPKAFSVKQLARELSLHETTICRAINNKTLATPIGLISMRSLFPQAVGACPDQSKATILHWIHQWISTEKNPLSDEAISQKIIAKGIPCARRTVAKYRSQLNIPPAHQRKHVNASLVP